MAKEFQRGSFRFCKMSLILDLKHNHALIAQNVFYIRSKITNILRYKISSFYSPYTDDVSTSLQTQKIANSWGNHTPYLKVMIIRGIGYRIFFIENDFLVMKAEQGLKTTTLDFSNSQQREIHDQNNSHVTSNEFDESMSYWAKASIEFPYSRYLIVRAGHTEDLYLPLKKNMFIKTSKKDRKMVIYGPDKQQINNLARHIFNYRPPSVYTGRGIRRKHLKPTRKEGKKDKQKGKSF